jgi:hypothetical protein
MFAAQPGLRGSVDGFGLHPYGPTAVDVGHWVAHFREVLDSLGEGSAPIDLTEFGWTTGDPIRETWRATMMRDLAYALSRSNCGIRILAPYDWINPYSMNEPVDFGFVDRTGSDTVLRPAAIAWFSELRVAPSLPEVPGCPAQPAAAKSPPPAANPPHKAKKRRRKPVHHSHHARRHKARRHQPPSARRHA